MARDPLLVIPAEEHERHSVHGEVRKDQRDPEPPWAFAAAPQQDEAPPHESKREERPRDGGPDTPRIAVTPRRQIEGVERLRPKSTADGGTDEVMDELVRCPAEDRERGEGH